MRALRLTTRVVAVLSALGVLIAAPPTFSEEPDLWESSIAPLVREGLRLNFEGHYDAADAIWSQLQDAYPRHPAGALFAVETLFWRQLYDLFDRTLDREIEDKGREAMRLAREWLDANPESARAALFVGQAEIQLGRLDGLLKKYYAAGRHAERGQEHLDAALELDPTLIDAHYWLGLYRYYASTLQSTLQLLSWLWFIPEPDGPGGLSALHGVSESGSDLRHAARLALMNIYSYYEEDHVRAAGNARVLNARFPDNTLIHFELLRILHEAGEHEAVVEEALRLESHQGVGALDRGRAAMARVWRARATFERGDIDAAAAILDQVDAQSEVLPTWGPGWILLLQGQIALAEGNRDAALSHFERAVEYRDRSPDAGRRAREAITRMGREPQRTAAPR